MTKTERLKAHHLNLCRFRPGSWDKRFSLNMAWLAVNAPETPLTQRQKWTLDIMIHRYRRQLVGRIPDDLMLSESPERKDYDITDTAGVEIGQTEQSGTVADMFNGDASPPHDHALDIPGFLLDPQGKLF